MLVFEEIIINYQKLKEGETPVLRDVHIEDGVVTYIDPRDKLKNLDKVRGVAKTFAEAERIASSGLK